MARLYQTRLMERRPTETVVQREPLVDKSMARISCGFWQGNRMPKWKNQRGGKTGKRCNSHCLSAWVKSDLVHRCSCPTTVGLVDASEEQCRARRRMFKLAVSADLQAQASSAQSPSLMVCLRTVAQVPGGTFFELHSAEKRDTTVAAN